MPRFSLKKLDSECGRTAELLSPYVDGRVSEQEKERVETHLASCQTCATELRSIRETVHLLQRLPAVRLPRSFALEAQAPRPSNLFYYLRNATAGLAAMLLVAFLSSLYLQAADPQYRASMPAPAPVLQSAQGTATESGALERQPDAASSGVQTQRKAANPPAATAEQAPRAAAPPAAPDPAPQAAKTLPAPQAAPNSPFTTQAPAGLPSSSNGLPPPTGAASVAGETKDTDQGKSVQTPPPVPAGAGDERQKETARVDRGATAPSPQADLPVRWPFWEAQAVGLALLVILGLATLAVWRRQTRA